MAKNGFSLKHELESQIKQLEREVTCQFCQGPLNDPRILECLHVFCKECINGLRLKANEPKYKCPGCKQHLIIPNIEKLVKFTLATTKIRDLKVLRQVSTDNPLCDVCPVRTNAVQALYVCLDCREGQQFLCDGCSKPHYHRPELRDHQPELLSQFLQSPITPQSLKRQRSTWASFVCNDHGFQLRYYCQTCNVGACMECLNETHKSHELYETGDAIGDAKKIISTELLDVLAIRSSLQESIKPIEETKHRIAYQEDFLKDEIKSRFLRIRKEVNYCEKMLGQQLQAVTQAKQDMLQQQLNNVSQLIDQADRVAEVMSESTSLPNESSLISITDLLLQKSRQLKDEYKRAASLSKGSAKIATIKKRASLTPCESADLTITLRHDSIKTDLREQSKIYLKSSHAPNCTASGPGLAKPTAFQLTYFRVHLKTSTGCPVIHLQDIQVQIKIQDIEGDLTEKPKIVHSGQGMYTVSYCPRISGVYEIKISINDEDINGSPFTVHVLPASPLANNASVFSSLQQLEIPWCITHDGKGNLLVCDRNHLGKLVVLDTNGKEKMRIVASEHLKALHCANGIAVADDDTIFVTSSYYHCISKFSPDGKLMVTIGKKGSLSGEFNNPSGIAIHSNQEVFVCDTLNNRVQIFTMDLEYKREITVNFISKKHKRLQLPSQPNDIAFNREDMIFVSDDINHCVLSFTSQERLRSAFWEVGGTINELQNPRGIAIDIEDFLYVSDSGMYTSHTQIQLQLSYIYLVLYKTFVIITLSIHFSFLV